MAKEIRFQIGQITGIGEHSTLRRVHRRFRQGFRKGRQMSEGSPMCGRESSLGYFVKSFLKNYLLPVILEKIIQISVWVRIEKLYGSLK